MRQKYFVEIGQQVHYLTVIGFGSKINRSGSRVTTTLFKCVCGNELESPISNVMASGIKSCGCQISRLCSLATKKRWAPFRLHQVPGDRALGIVFSEYRGRAKYLKLDFGLTFQEFKELSSKPCFYCGHSPFRVKIVGDDHCLHNGVDRVDNSLGYVNRNLVPCCSICNYAKQTMTQAEFFSWIKRVYGHLQHNGQFNLAQIIDVKLKTSEILTMTTGGGTAPSRS
jgi:hypothetical protein